MFTSFAIFSRAVSAKIRKLPIGQSLCKCSWILCTALSPLSDVREIDEYIRELADKGEVDDINYANLKTIPHKRLIYKVSVCSTPRALYSFGSKKLLSEKKQKLSIEKHWVKRLHMTTGLVPLRAIFGANLGFIQISLGAGIFLKENKCAGIR